MSLLKPFEPMFGVEIRTGARAWDDLKVAGNDSDTGRRWLAARPDKGNEIVLRFS